MITFRQATVADIPELHRIRLAVKENALSNPDLVKPEDYVPFLETRGRGWLAEEEGRVLGFAIADLQEQNIWALFVDPSAEGRGIGRELHRVIMDWYFTRLETVWLSTAPGTRAAAFYRKAGWKENGTYGKGEIRFEMTREGWKNEVKPG